MESALAWIGQIAAWLGRFIPRREILDTTEGAIKYKGGAEPIFCGPGIHWWWPWTSTWVVYPMARQTDRLETQTMESKDGKTFLASGTITYEVTDLMKLVPRTHSPATATVDIAMTVLHRVCCKLDWADLQEKQRRDTIKTDLRNAAQDALGDFGIDVVMLKLNSLARCRVLKISQSTSAEEN
jgi:regulator of protease activity HflC (stomatin/prohibitin superfamily)